MTLKIFPWEKDEKPYFINPENGVEWYIEKSMTDYCKAEINDWPKLNAVAFIVAQRVNGEIKPIERVLIDIATNEVIFTNPRMEDMAVKIDSLRLKMGSK